MRTSFGASADDFYKGNLLSSLNLTSDIALRSSQSILDSDSTPSSNSEDSGLEKSELGTHVLLDPKTSYLIRPFDMLWCFGFDCDAPIVNLTRQANKKEIMYLSNNNIVIFNYETQSMSFLEAHQNKIITISIEKDGQYMVTADAGTDSCIIVWDTLKLVPVYTVFDPYPESAIHAVGISTNGRYLVTVGSNEDDDYLVDLWLWTTGETQSSGTVTVRYSRGKPKKVVFNPNKEEHIMIVFESTVALLVWDEENQKLTDVTFPTLRNKSKLGNLTDGTYINHGHECYASSNQGYILKFGNTLYTRPFAESELDNKKTYINAVKVTTGSVTCMTYVDDVVVVGDSLGNIMYYDKSIRILLWHSNLGIKAVKCISINLDRKRPKFEPIGTYDILMQRKKNESTVSLETHFVPKPRAASGSTIGDDTLSTKDCFISTGDGNIYAIEILTSKCHPIFYIVDSNVGAIDTHSERPYILIAYENGRLCLYNYYEYEQIAQSMLPEAEKPSKTDDDYDEDNAEKNEKVTVTCVKYCNESLHLACGRSNGELWFLDPILLVPRGDKFRVSSGRILKIAFSAESTQLAYIDTRNTTYLFLYSKNEEQWMFRAKTRAHYKDVTDILFYPNLPSTLMTIGQDRTIVKYNNCKMRNWNEIFEPNKFRIEQVAVPDNMMWYPLIDITSNTGFILIADNQYKFKLYNDDNMIPNTTVLGPAYGCYKSNPVRKMMLIPETQGEYMVYMSKKHIGIQILPADGNPYKYVGCTAHHEQVQDIVLSYDGKYAFTFGYQDKSVVKWRINLEGVRTMEQIGGTGLEPFYCLLEGGKNGWLFHEMQDLFYYMQILNMGENTVLPRKVSDTIPISELPDLVRACGYYPSDFEIESMMIDIKNRDIFETNVIREEISFKEFVQLFINHRPAYGYALEDLQNAFDTYVLSIPTPDYGSISKENFVETMITTGEAFNEQNLFKCLSILLGEDEEAPELDFEFLPDSIDFDTFIDDILGIDMDRRELDIEDHNEAKEPETDTESF